MDDDPDYEITITRVIDRAPRCATRLRKAVAHTLRRHNTRWARINVALIDDAGISHLNEQHLRHHGPTDVLAFDLRELPGAAFVSGREQDDTRSTGSGGSNGGESLDGEIVVSVDTAAREAGERGHRVEAELALYVVHGTLHLLGYDDRDGSEATRMHEIEDEILSAIGLGPVYRANRP